MERLHPWAKETLNGYLFTMIDNAVAVDGAEVTEADLAFVVGRSRQADGSVARVDRRSLSEGTLRLTAVLAALFQRAALDGAMPLIAIEEPEISLHPPMLGALYDALVAASHNTQVIVTTQSADLLDNVAADPMHLLVARDDGTGTAIGPIDDSGRHLLADGVLTLPDSCAAAKCDRARGRQLSVCPVHRPKASPAAVASCCTTRGRVAHSGLASNPT
ncbi:AAA family ATPase [Streptomyces sp. NPDC048291]|uniref:AAA family ATPase n=1 Tax=Streptomyces sp. NPDC048291 TaxID=3365530 RepID=UPI0037182618